MWNRFLTNNSASMRTLRTIVQGVIGVIIANLDLVVGNFAIPTEYKPMIVALVMAILSPVMSEIGLHTTEVVTNDDIVEGAE